MLKVCGFSAQLSDENCLKITNLFLDSIYQWFVDYFTNLEGKWLYYSTGININRVYAHMCRY